ALLSPAAPETVDASLDHGGSGGDPRFFLPEQWLAAVRVSLLARLYALPGRPSRTLRSDPRWLVLVPRGGGRCDQRVGSRSVQPAVICATPRSTEIPTRARTRPRAAATPPTDAPPLAAPAAAVPAARAAAPANPAAPAVPPRTSTRGAEASSARLRSSAHRPP